MSVLFMSYTNTRARVYKYICNIYVKKCYGKIDIGFISIFYLLCIMRRAASLLQYYEMGRVYSCISGERS